ncbi:MAG TPA: protein phosphatase 2C domain-containing protein [Anaerolineaceae bacterium]
MENNPFWQVIGTSIRGAQHIRNGAIRQDAIHWLPEDGAGLPLIVALADGHGSPTCFRSGIGAIFATIALESCLLSLVNSLPSIIEPSSIYQYLKELLPRKITQSWLELVNDHLGKSPISSQELSHLKEKAGEESIKIIQNKPDIAYGTTIQGGLLTDRFFLGLQLGDGQILTVSEDGEITPLLPDCESLLGNETFSLCNEDAWNYFSTWFIPIIPGNSSPLFYLFSTDGFVNSFSSNKGVYHWADDLYQMLYSSQPTLTIQQLAANLPGWLDDVSRLGSGDDITMAMICRSIGKES